MLHHYILTRFSILDEKFKGFTLTKENHLSKIRSTLFNKARLQFKFRVFDKMTYPSIQQQTDPNFTWLIYASVYLPEQWKKKLEAYREDRIHIVYVRTFAEMNEDIAKRIKDSASFTTIRLDDDDGLHPKFLETLNQYEKDVGSIVSMPNGRKYKLEGDRIVFHKDRIHRKHIALGLTAIGFNIFTAGNHTRVHDHHRVLYNSLRDAYSVCASEFCDTKRPFHNTTRKRGHY